MVQLGKYVKGKAPSTTDKRNVQIRMRTMVQELDFSKEMHLQQIRRDNLKTMMQEEMRMAHLNRMKILNWYRKVLRLTKTEQLKKDIQIYQQNHDREVDAKDAILQMLDRDLDEAEEQYQMALRNHLIHIDDLINLQNSRLRGLQEEFDNDVKIIKTEYDRERADIERNHHEETRELIEMIQCIEDEETLKLKEMQDIHDGEREETKNKNNEDLESIKHDLIKQIEKLDKEFEMNFSTYVNETENRAMAYKQLLEDGKKSTDEIQGHQDAIAQAKAQNQLLTLKKQQNKREYTDRNNAVLKELRRMSDHYHALKKKMKLLREDKEKHLGSLALDSLNCMKTLREFQHLGEKILKTAELCRKLETEKEKVPPFYASDPDTQNEPDIDIPLIAGLDKKEAYNEFRLLDNFYKRFNKVHLDKLSIEKQKATLEKENLFFKNLLKQYLDGVSVNDDVMNANNPLLIFNNKVSLNRPPVVADDTRNITKIEGNHEVNNVNMQRNANYH